MNVQLLVTLALAGAVQAAVSAADITGKITLKGTPTPEVPVPLDPQCGQLHKQGLTTRFYVVSSAGGLADTFVYLKEGVPAKKYETPAKPAVLDQKGCEYIPYVLGAQTGQTIEVKNSDPVLHNVHPTPLVAGNKEDNKAQLPNGPVLKFKWENPEIFLRFKCDIHPWMFAYVGLLDHPFHAVSDKDGSFKIANVPPGKYVVEAYHRKLGKQTSQVTVAEEGTKAEFTFEVK